MPVYNVLDYLDDAVASIRNQTYTKLQIILVDDGSTDGSGARCDELARTDKRISVIHKPNGGLSSARNAGVPMATGKYMMFVDSDDELTPRGIELLVGSLETSGSDIATGNAVQFNSTFERPAWNQSRSHVQGAATGTTLHDYPTLLFDTAAWNKLIRRSMYERLSISYPEGKLYEDQVPSMLMFTGANGIDVVVEPVYRYRLRESGDSITQRRNELKNLADKIEMIDRTIDLLEGPEDPALADVLFGKALNGDLRPYIAYLGRDAEFDKRFTDAAVRYWQAATPAVRNALSLELRAFYTYLPRGVEEAATAHVRVAKLIPALGVIRTGSGPVLDTSPDPELFEPLGDARALDMSLYVQPRHRMARTALVDGRLSCTGWAYIDLLDNPEQQHISLSLRHSSGETIDIPLRRVTNASANLGNKSTVVDHSDNSFEVDVAVDELFGSLPRTAPIAGGWNLHLRVRDAEFDFTFPVTTFSQHSAEWVRGVADLPGNRQVRLVTGTGTLRLAVAEPPAIATHLTLHGNQLLVDFLVPDGREVRATRLAYSGDLAPQAMHLTTISDPGNVRWRTRASLPASMEAAKGQWRIEVQFFGSAQWHQLAHSRATAQSVASDHNWLIRTERNGAIRVRRCANTAVVERVEINENGYTFHGSLRGAALHVTAVFTGKDGHAYRVPVEQDGKGGFRCVVDPGVQPENQQLSWKADTYQVWMVDEFDHQFAVVADRAVAETVMPLVAVGSRVRANLWITNAQLNLRLGVYPPLQVEDRTSFGRQKFRDAIAQAQVAEPVIEDAILLYGYAGVGSADSALELWKEIVRRGLPIKAYWGVTNLSVPIPAGTEPVVVSTRRWYELLERARFVVNNIFGPEGYADHDFQVFVQTWHGTALKHIGRSLVETRPLLARTESLMHARKVAAEWELFVSPSPFFTTLIEPEFFYTGRVVESGFPRNDPLALATTQTQQQIRAELGIDEHSRVLLYTPTWRDQGRRGWASPLFSELDLDALSESLGPDWTIILRGHSFNVRHSVVDSSRGRIIDLSLHPDINDLYIASDAMITDYSSTMFDYLVTRKPLLYFVPDLEDYYATRGTYMTLQSAAAGPITFTQDELTSELLRLDTYQERFGEVYERQREKYTPWDDGHAASRVVDAMLEVARDRDPRLPY